MESFGNNSALDVITNRKMKILPKISFIIFTFSLLALQNIWANLYPWTDSSGRTLQAKFLQADQDTLTIEVNGQPFEIPVNTLSPESKALAVMLQAQQAKPSVKLYDWTDTSGRTIKAAFIKSTQKSITLEVSGRQTTLPLSMFNDASQALAEKLGGQKIASERREEQASNPNVNVPKVDLNTELNLSSVYPWTNQAGQTLMGKYLESDKENMIISMNDGRREVTIALETLSKDSLALAKKLAALKNLEAKEIIALAKKRKGLKVPDMEEGDLIMEHSLTNSKGQSIKAKFISSSESEVTLLISGKSSPMNLSWSSFSDESITLLESLRRLQAKLESQKPKVVPARKNRLSYFASGKYKGYNSIIDRETHMVGVQSSGRSLDIFVKQGKDTSSSNSPGVKRVGVNFATYYTDKSNSDPRKHRRRSRVIQSFDEFPDASTDRELLTLKGKYTNGGTFEYNIDLKERELKLWSKIKDPSGEKWPSRHQISIGVPGVVANAINLSMGQINSAVGNGVFDFRPVSGKAAKVPMNMKWTDVRKKMKVNTNNLNSMDLYGKPYDPLKISITSVSHRDMRLDMDKAYAKTFPLQGISLDYFTLEERKRKEIPRSNALKIVLSPR